MRLVASLLGFVTLSSMASAQSTAGSRSGVDGEGARAPIARPAPAPVPQPERAANAPEIDGKGDDAIWSKARPITEFRQWEPLEDTDPSFRTEARIAYDEHNLYVFVRSFDPHPDSLLALLQRRDSWGTSDEVVLSVDSYNDRRTGYMFRLTPAGTMSDGYVFNDDNEDWGWNAVWEGKARVDSLGWTAEYRIPLSQLRYVPTGDNTFGIQLNRRIARRGERVAWPLYRQSRTGKVSQWAPMPGFASLSAPRRMEVVPYTVARYGASPLGDGTPRNAARTQIGADLKLGLTPNITLDGAVNPDFGQVEADPGVLNLGASEQFFSERRPFFLEGSGIFRYDLDCDMGACSGLFYSRRIGRSPQLRGRFGDMASPMQSTILGAAKVTGRLGSGLSVGFLDGITSQEMGTSERTIEPQTNYAVVRLQQDIAGGNSGVGLILTNTTRQNDQWTRNYLRGNAWTGGFDARHCFDDNRWEVSGQLVGSRVSGTAQAIALTQRSNVHLYQRPDADHLEYDSTRTSLSGWMTQVKLEKQGGGITRLNTSVWYTTPGLEINDLGFRTRSDETGASVWFSLRPVTPVGFFRRANMNVSAQMATTTDGMMLENGGNVNGWGEFSNLWSINMGIGTNNLVAAYSDRDARGGPALFLPRRMNMWWNVNGDNRRNIIPRFGGRGGRRLDGLGSNWNASVGADFRVGSQFNGGLNLEYGRNIDDQQWYGNFVDNGVAAFTFARLYQATSSATLRLNYTITPTLSFESYLQPFVSTGRYTDWRAIEQGRSSDRDTRFQPYSARGEASGFRFGQLRSNNVVRWEYRPGSVLFFVWTQGRDDSASNPDQHGIGSSYSNIFQRRPDNVFLIKASYWFGR